MVFLNSFSGAVSNTYPQSSYPSGVRNESRHCCSSSYVFTFIRSRNLRFLNKKRPIQIENVPDWTDHNFWSLFSIHSIQYIQS